MARPGSASYGLPPHVQVVRAANGRSYFYYQKHRATGRQQDRVKLPGEPFGEDGTPNAVWWEFYRGASGMEVGAGSAAPGTFGALISEYKQSPEWGNLAAGTRREWARHLARVEEAWGKLRVAGLEARHALKLRDRYAATPAQANNLLRALSSMVSWSVPRGWCRFNPVLSVKKLKGGPGYAPWSWDGISLFKDKGRRELWYAVALALYTGQRQGDVIGMNWDDIEDGLIAVEQEKTKKKLWIPMHRDLKAVLAEVARREECGRILLSSRKQEWTVGGFRQSWQEEMRRPEFAALRAGSGIRRYRLRTTSCGRCHRDIGGVRRGLFSLRG